ncbi:hypothetical protein NQ318_006346 [Aromia moschata]|uniref:Uncharacterized protein n=1 Tax=Aromia moschata TaxID=1265417 RepID=A0AAV8XGY5_9CUCU|nr:hypothetical protein NQ318_006346 [Aromia moschata]
MSGQNDGVRGGLTAKDCSKTSSIYSPTEVERVSVTNILWSDESRFHNNGIVNKHNAHYWSNQNPHWMTETRFQTVWGTNVWCGMFNGHLIGPHFFEGTLTKKCE